ncbi:MAG: delta-60 repeat domain-containing protein [Flavobacteriales bacterium]|nr:delta-60 repeat domain-containing protein [Flavobacteriales bacterium]
MGGGTTFTNIKTTGTAQQRRYTDQSLSIVSGFNSGTVRQILRRPMGFVIYLGNSPQGLMAAPPQASHGFLRSAPSIPRSSSERGSPGISRGRLLSPDGKLVVVGTFTAYNGFLRQRCTLECERELRRRSVREQGSPVLQ